MVHKEENRDVIFIYFYNYFLKSEENHWKASAYEEMRDAVG